jgi:hypothetical protein
MVSPSQEDRRRAQERVHRASRKDQINARRRERWRTEPTYRKRIIERMRRKRYGISHSEWAHLLALQGGVCAICHRAAHPLCIDHCHATGQVRGLLCRKCNSGLGYYADNPARLRAAADYLERMRLAPPLPGVGRSRRVTAAY